MKQLTLLKFVYILLLIPFVVYPAFAVEYDQIVSTSDGTLDIGIYTIPEVPNTTEPTKLKISFLKPGTDRIQEHIDYRVTVTKDGDYIFGPIRLTHTSPGHVTIPVQFSENGLHMINVEVEGVLFTPIPLETASLTMNIGQAQTSIPGWIKNNAGWWADGQIDDGSFVSGIQWLISNNVMTIPPTEQGTGSDDVIPGWIKNNAGWWADGQIDDASFLNGIEYLIDNSILEIQSNQKSNENGMIQLEKLLYEVPYSSQIIKVNVFAKFSNLPYYDMSQRLAFTTIQVTRPDGEIDSEDLRASHGVLNYTYMIKSNSPVGEYEISIRGTNDNDIFLEPISFKLQVKSAEEKAVPAWVKK